MIDRGMSFLWNNHRDSEYGGYHWGVGYDGASDSAAGLLGRHLAGGFLSILLTPGA
jgi:mannose/cellobiose epimerase-like protein (N-acyl-D-glucosamine 2-epimerase family)